MREIADQKNFEYGHFLHSAKLSQKWTQLDSVKRVLKKKYLPLESCFQLSLQL